MPPDDFVQSVADGCTIALRIHPGAKRNAVTGVHDGTLKIALSAPPVDGKANAALILYLAKLLGISRSSLSLVQGTTNRRKTIHVAATDIEQIRIKLAEKIVL